MKSYWNIILWIVQVLLAALFLFGGVFKLVVPIETLTAQSPLPGLFLQFIGVCEVIGGLGLLLPGMFRFKPILTPLAALGLLIIMIGAVVITIMTMSIMSAIFPFIILVLTAFVGYGRWDIYPHGRNIKKRK